MFQRPPVLVGRFLLFWGLDLGGGEQSSCAEKLPPVVAVVQPKMWV